MTPLHSPPPASSRIKDVVRIYYKETKAFHFLELFVIIVVIGANLIQLVVPLYYKKFFDLLVATGVLDPVHELRHIILIILGLHLLMWMCHRFHTFSQAHINAWGMKVLRHSAFEYLMGHSYTFFTNNFSGSLVQRVGRFTRAYQRLMDRLSYDMVPLLIQIVGSTIVLWTINHTFALVVLLWAAVFLGCNYFFALWKLKYDLRMAESDSKTTGVIADTISNQQTVQLFHGYARESSRLDSVLHEQTQITLSSWKLSNGFDALQALLLMLIEFIAFYIAIDYWHAGIFTIGTFALIQAYIIDLGNRMWSFSRVIRDLYECFADAKEMTDIMLLPYDIKDIPDAKPLMVTKGEIVLHDVTFGFREEKNVIEHLDLTIKGGEHVALVGPSGAGKSTFVRLLLRLYDVSGGEITIDGQNIAEITQESLRTQISFVPQDPVLFHRTLKENIRYGNPAATDEEVFRAAGLAHCEKFIKELPEGYETYVGERGIKLSGGERQRIAIARAILKNAPIIILDEATSSLDSESEALIQSALENLMKGKTTIVIAHRLSTIKQLDRVIVLEDGKVIEDGTHDTLSKKTDSLYAKLWRLQSGGYGGAFEEEVLIPSPLSIRPPKDGDLTPTH